MHAHGLRASTYILEERTKCWRLVIVACVITTWPSMDCIGQCKITTLRWIDQGAGVFFCFLLEKIFFLLVFLAFPPEKVS